LRDRRMIWNYGFPELLDIEKVQEDEGVSEESYFDGKKKFTKSE